MVFAVIILLLAVSGCQRSTRERETGGRAGSPRPVQAGPGKLALAPSRGGEAGKGKTAAPASGVTRIVFLDKYKACECDRKRMEAGWKALSEVIGDTPGVVVERIHMDTQPLLAAPMRSKRATMVLPGLYFLGKDDKLHKLLQGDVTADQIRKALK